MTTVRLTTKQRLVLMDIQNQGYKERIEGPPCIVLLNLGLIERRTVYSGLELKQRRAERHTLSNQIIALLRAGRIKEAGKAMNDLESHFWHDEDKAWFLTRFGLQCLNTGSVIVKIGGPKHAAKEEHAA